MKCKCHPDSPFHWQQNPRPSMFVKDIYFRPKAKQVYEDLTKEENVLAYKQFSIHSRAHPKINPPRTSTSYEMSCMRNVDFGQRDPDTQDRRCGDAPVRMCQPAPLLNRGTSAVKPCP